MTYPDPTRRRSPQWVRDLDSRVLHAMAFRFNADRQSEDLSDAQEWLYDALISELEYRHRRATNIRDRCSCELCLPPFTDWLPPEP